MLSTCCDARTIVDYVSSDVICTECGNIVDTHYEDYHYIYEEMSKKEEKVEKKFEDIVLNENISESIYNNCMDNYQQTRREIKSRINMKSLIYLTADKQSEKRMNHRQVLKYKKVIGNSDTSVENVYVKMAKNMASKYGIQIYKKSKELKKICGKLNVAPKMIACLFLHTYFGIELKELSQNEKVSLCAMKKNLKLIQL